jgi:hypothetical protein
VFAGDARKITAVWRNAGDKTATVEVGTRLCQTSSATVSPLAEKPWKKIEVLPGQTVLEFILMDFPAVNAETRFLIQWLEGTNHVIGTTDVLVYPTNLLAELKMLAGEEPLGMFDPGDQLKPLLKSAKVDIVDLEDTGLEDFRGKLAIVGPYESKAQMREGSANQIQVMARKGVAVVWLQPPQDKRDKLQPSFFPVPEGQIATVVVQANMVADLAENPRSQFNLIHFCRLALRPVPPQLPHLTPKP